VKKLLLTLAGIAVAFSAMASLSKYKDWDKGPEAYFLTPAERADWKNLQTDEDAEKFIALYYAKRGGDAFKQEISRRIAAADQQFKMQRYKRGADSVRGRLLIVLGTPSRVSQSRAQDEVTGDGSAIGLARPGLEGSNSVTYIWTYLADKFPPAFGIGEVKAEIEVDPAQGRDKLQKADEIEQALATVAEKSIVNPNATVVVAPAAGAAAPKSAAPAAGGTAAGAPPAAAAAAPAVATQPLPEAVKTALAGMAGKTTGDAGFWSGTFWSAGGDQFLALQFYLPTNKPAFAAATPLKFGGLVTDESGKEVDSFWEDATFTEVTEGTRKDRVFDRSVTLQPGSYKGTFGLFPAEGQPAVASSSISFKLEPKSAEFAVSPLILANGLVPLTKRPGPADPFVFGTDKPIKVDPKGDHTFAKSDSLWYFYSVENPAQPAAAAGDAAAAPPPPATPAAGGAAPAPAATAAKPRVMTRINVQREGQDAFAPFTGPAELVQTAPGVYSTGSEIPLASFEPGYYTFLINVRDLNAAKGSPASKGIDRREDFVVLMPDGSLPPKNAPKAAPAPKKKPS
jgi:GWxTD domain-containing protein